MRWLKATLLPLVAIASGWVAVFVLEIADYLLDYRFLGSPTVAPWMTSAYALVFLAVPLFAGFFGTWALRSWWPWSVSLHADTPRRRLTYWVLGCGYVLTAAVGSPMVQNDLTEMVIGYYRTEQEMSRISPFHRTNQNGPYGRTFLCVPLFPGVVVAYHEYQAGLASGAGAFYVVLWYGGGVRRVTSFQRWLS